MVKIGFTAMCVVAIAVVPDGRAGGRRETVGVCQHDSANVLAKSAVTPVIGSKKVGWLIG